MLPWGGGENLDSAQGKRVDININNNYIILALDGVAHWLDCQLSKNGYRILRTAESISLTQ